MQPFQRAEFVPHTKKQIKAMAKEWGTTEKEVRKALKRMMETESVYKNDKFQVTVRDMGRPFGANAPAMLWLSIKRLNKEPITDWRTLQEVKNALLSPEHEAVELYPAESRVTDTANQYHLFAFRDSRNRWPFGFTDGKKLYTASPESGAKQRAKEDV